MSISQIGAATGTTTATVPAHNVGDLIVIFAYRSGSTAAPSLGAGFTSVLTKSGTTSSARIGFKIATSTSDASGTWTNASNLTCLVYSSSTYATGSSLFIGGSASSSSTTTTVNYPALTMTHTDGTSWAIGFAGTSVATAALSTHAPAGMTFFTNSDVTATTEVSAFDTNGTVSSWSSTNTTVSATGNSVSATIELIENQPGTVLSNIVQHVSFAYNDANAVAETSDFYAWNIDPTLANNGILAAFIYQDAGHTPNISDDKGNTWGAADVTAGIAGGGTVLAVYHINNATTGTSQIRLDFGGNPQSQVQAKFTQLFNVTGTVEGTSTATAVTPTGGVVVSGAYTPSAANSIIFTFIADANKTLNNNPAMIVPDTNSTLLDADIAWGTGGMTHASEYSLQTTAVSYTPRMYLNTSNTLDRFQIVSVALSTGSQGTLPATGPGQAPWIKKMLHFGTNSSVVSMLMQIPSEGNGGVFTTFLQDSGTPHLTSMIDNDGVTWTLNQPAGLGGVFLPSRFNSSQRTNRTITATISGTGQNIQFIYYDIANLATSSTIVASTGTTGSSTGATITPTGTNQLTIAYLQIGTGPAYGIITPTGAVFDLPTASTWKGTGSISGTTLTKSTTTWGVFDATTIQSPILSGAGISGGTAPVSGGPTTFTINPNNGTVALEALSLSTSDVNTMNWGNGAGHIYNAGNTSAQVWNFGVSQNTVGSPGGEFGALILAGPSAAASVAKIYETLQAVKRAAYW